MHLKIPGTKTSYSFEKFKHPLRLSAGREIAVLRKRTVTLEIKTHEKHATGEGSILDSTPWANPPHLNPSANPTTDLEYFELASIKIAEALTALPGTTPFQADTLALTTAITYAEEFSTRRNYKLPGIMPPMAAAPFSIAIWNALGKITPHDIFTEIDHGILTSDFKNHTKTNAELSPAPARYIPWMMTLGIIDNIHDTARTIAANHAKQVKIKIENNEQTIEKTMELLKLLGNTKFYFDANRDFPSMNVFRSNFLDPLLTTIPPETILGIEEPSIYPEQLPDNLPIPIFLDESAFDIDAPFLDMGYAIVLKLTRPLTTLLEQKTRAFKKNRPACVQDLTFTGNALELNLQLRSFTNTPVGFETNQHLLLENPSQIKHIIKDGMIHCCP